MNNSSHILEKNILKQSLLKIIDKLDQNSLNTNQQYLLNKFLIDFSSEIHNSSINESDNYSKYIVLGWYLDKIIK